MGDTALSGGLRVSTIKDANGGNAIDIATLKAATEQTGNIQDGSLNALLHMDGAPGSIAFPDFADSPHAVTASGNAAVAAGGKFGNGELVLNVGTDWLAIPQNAASEYQNLLENNHTLGGWFKWDILPINTETQILVGFGTGTGLKLVNQSGQLSLQYSGLGSGPPGWSVNGDVSLSTGTWYHVSGVRNGNDFSLRLDGVEVASGVEVSALTTVSTTMYVGSSNGSAGEFKGRVDEVRISSVARYTADFTPATAPFVGQIAEVIRTIENLDVDSAAPETVYEIEAVAGTASLLHFLVSNSAETALESGTLLVHSDGTNVESQQTKPIAIGTVNLVLSTDFSGGNMRIRATTTEDDMKVAINDVSHLVLSA